MNRRTVVPSRVIQVRLQQSQRVSTSETAEILGSAQIDRRGALSTRPGGGAQTGLRTDPRRSIDERRSRSGSGPGTSARTVGTARLWTDG
ncbi:hypothetical protein C8039_03080 [Halogeometricum sp. wsp3]|nr:hypothetical protein C8039_03080 [Halogeometricum sp. wsp3]